MDYPCGKKDAKGRIKYPAVNCDHRCGNCAWLPGETERRLANGRWIRLFRVQKLLFKRR